MRLNNVKIEECPKFFTGNPSRTPYTTVILATEDNSVEETLIPLSIKGVASYFPTRKLTLSEYECAEREGRSFDLTYDSPEWDPHTNIFNQQETAAKDFLDTEDRELHSV